MAKLTKRTVDAAPARARDYVVWDDELPRFGLRVRRSGTRTYVVQYRAKGRTRLVTLGRPGPLTPDHARRLALGVLAEVAAGRDPADLRDADRRAITLRQLSERYMEEHSNPKKKPRSSADDQRMLDKHILPALGSHRMVEIRRGDLEKLHVALRDRPTAANRVISLLSSLFHFAERLELAPPYFNPCRGIRRYPENRRERFLSAAELTELGKALNELEATYVPDKDPRREKSELPAAVAAVRLLIFTGARMGEILNLRWEHVELERGLLRLPDSKTGAKVIHLNAPALELLTKRHEARDGSPWVIPGRDPSKPLVNLGKIWRRVRERAEMKDVRLHDLRHSFASMGAAAGLSLPLIGALLGHRQVSTTQRYAHLADDPIRSANELVGSRIAAALEGRESAQVLTIEERTPGRPGGSGRESRASARQADSHRLSPSRPKPSKTGHF